MSYENWTTEQIAQISVDDICRDLTVSERALFLAVLDAGWDYTQPEYTDISSGNVSGMIYNCDVRRFSERWEQEIEELPSFGELMEFLMDGQDVSIQQVRHAYCQIAASWAGDVVTQYLDIQEPWQGASWYELNLDYPVTLIAPDQAGMSYDPVKRVYVMQPGVPLAGDTDAALHCRVIFTDYLQITEVRTADGEHYGCLIEGLPDTPGGLLVAGPEVVMMYRDLTETIETLKASR